MNHNRVNWEDKSPMCYSHWNRGEPSGDGFAVEMTKWGGWNDLWTEHKRTFICQATGESRIEVLRTSSAMQEISNVVYSQSSQNFV